MHGHVGDSFSEEYKALYHYYESLYISPVINEKQALKAEMEYRTQQENNLTIDKKTDSVKTIEKASTKPSSKASEKTSTKSSNKQDSKQKTKKTEKSKKKK